MSADANDPIQIIFNDLAKAEYPARQQELLVQLKNAAGPYYLDFVAQALHFNPVLELPPGERTALIFKQRLNELATLKQIAQNIPGKRICVYCMQKSGSTFTKAAIAAALPSNFVHLTSHAADTSAMGANGREPEMDELAILFAIFRTRGHFVAQHHTRCTPFLSHQLRFYGITPIVMTRNIYDGLISADDMFLSWRQNGSNWIGDSPFMLPIDYEKRETAERITILAHSYGIWAINFYLSWKRCERAGIVKPLWLTYEDDISNKERFKERIAAYLGMNAEQSQRLAAFVGNPDAGKSRLNVGKVGRGANVPDAARTIVVDYARLFRNELDSSDIQVLFGQPEL